MKLIVWNIDRAKSLPKRGKIISALMALDADIIILTETTQFLDFGTNMHRISTDALPEFYEGQEYKNGENRTTIFSRYPVLKSYPTYNTYNSVCADLETPHGLLRIYGTITGGTGGKDNYFKNDLKNQLKDFDSLLPDINSCIAGDLNTTFSGYAYPGHAARNAFNNSFEKLALTNLTAGLTNNVNHIVISNLFIKDKTINISIFNNDKKISDHAGICVEIF